MIGWAVGMSGLYGAVFATTDGGNTWTNQYAPTQSPFFAISMFDTQTGWIAGQSGLLYKTTNGGANWTTQSTGTLTYFMAAKAVSPTVCWLAGLSGILFKTTDGGATWVQKPVCTENNLMSMAFADANTAWIAGDYGTILHTTNGGSTFAPEPAGMQVPNGFELFQNYPNPFNPSTTIVYDLPKEMHVRLAIYNILGQEVTTLVNDTQKSGHRSITWNGAAVASGVYYYHLQAGDFVATKKLMLVK
jgi:hypothetical protein